MNLINNKPMNFFVRMTIYLLLFLSSFVVSAEESGALNLSDSERQWLQEHQDIVIAYDGDFPPYSEQLSNGDFQGYAIDVVKIVEQRLGIKFKVYPDGIWKNLFDAAKNREVDVVVTMNPIPERRQWFIFSDDYIFLSTTLFARVNDHRFTSASDISVARLALVEGYAGNTILLERFPNTTPVLFEKMTEALTAVNEGEADIYFGPDYIAKELLREHNLENVEPKFIYELNTSDQTLGIRKDWHELKSIINKALAGITSQEWGALYKKWIDGHGEKMKLTTGESAQRDSMDSSYGEIDTLPQAGLLILHVDLPQHPDIPARKKVERLRALAEKHNIQLSFKAVPWKRGLVMIEKGTADGIIGASYNDERAQYAVYPMKGRNLDITKKISAGGVYHLYKNKNSTIAWNGEKFTNPDGPVAVKEGNAVIDDLKKHTNIEIVVSANENIIVRDLLSGKVAAYAALDEEIQNYSDTQQFKNTVIREPIPLRQKPYFVIFSKISYAQKKDEIEKFWNMLRE